MVITKQNFSKNNGKSSSNYNQRLFNLLVTQIRQHWISLYINLTVDCAEKDDLAQTGYDQNQTGLAVQIHLIRASKPANNIREFTDQSSILNRSHYRSPIAKYRYRTFPYSTDYKKVKRIM